MQIRMDALTQRIVGLMWPTPKLGLFPANLDRVEGALNDATHDDEERQAETLSAPSEQSPLTINRTEQGERCCFHGRAVDLGLHAEARLILSCCESSIAL